MENKNDMNIIKQDIIDNICYTEHVYERINKKMKLGFQNSKLKNLYLILCKKLTRLPLIKKEKTFILLTKKQH